MTADMISVSRCIALSGLGGDEIVLGVTRAKRHDELYENYLRNFGKRCAALRDRIVGDIRASLNVGAMRLAADLFIVLRLALARRLADSRDGRRRNVQSLRSTRGREAHLVSISAIPPVPSRRRAAKLAPRARAPTSSRAARSPAPNERGSDPFSTRATLASRGGDLIEHVVVSVAHDLDGDPPARRGVVESVDRQ